MRRSKWVKRFKERIMQSNRRRKLDDFYALYSGGKVLDVGVSGKTTMEAGNLFLKSYLLPDETYTGLGIDDMTEVKKMHPGKRFVEYDGKVFPFQDREFEWVFSNAVVEHVGFDDEQVFFIDEMMRVGQQVFFTTPNKYFPIEAHTNLPLLHWNNNLFYRWCAKHRPWTDQSNLYLFSKHRLKQVMNRTSASRYRIVENRVFGWPMTFTVICSRDS